ncbi:T9SS outer membrane translocon Sov/SprA [Marinifilum sp. D737]|uniref:T9SS outer membrane translocon Sov/SprA n=1 Tax=Marinifilum sp. D737 TaxID=2969628 RepID=UPI0022735F6A|nr:cell surface protein SprA [Marinifilum sp. D737]MCY1635390.1 cell surface protein SprA [Marinifilum sp. D737]
MKKLLKYTLSLCVVIFCFVIKSNQSVNAYAYQLDSEFSAIQQQDTTLRSGNENKRIINSRSPFNKDNPNAKNDSLRYPFNDENDNLEYGSQQQSPLYLKDPSNIKTSIKYDPATGNYILVKTIGDMNYRRAITMTAEEYEQYVAENSIRDYWMQRSRNDGAGGNNELVPDLNFGGQFIDKIFGSNTIKIKPQGSAELTFGISTTNVENPTLPENLRKTTSFDFDEKIQMNVTGTVGEKLKMDVNYNTEATFDFENQMRLEYTGDEDEIIKKVEAGNVSMPISNTLITGGQNLFGVKTQMQFGKLGVTSVFSQQKGETAVVNLENGAQKNEFEISVDQYEANRHFFLSKYFYDTYDKALENLPVVNSGVAINKVEVWVTNKTSNFQDSRNVVAFVDIGESAANISNAIFSQTGTGVLPDNELNNVYQQMTETYSDIRDVNKVTETLGPLAPGFTSGKDYEKVENARKLSPSEYTINEKLGYISLNQALNADEVLAVAYEYTNRGQVFRVGEFTSDGVSAPQSLVMKLLKGTNLSPGMPTWKLMMKNIYNIGAYQVNQDDFVLNIMYQNDQAGTKVNYLPEGDIKNEILLKVMNLDRLNSQLDPGSDGMFDFINGITIYSNNGRVIFPIIEPFGSYLRGKIGNDAIANKYVFDELYEKTQNEAQQIAEKNKYSLKGSYKSSSSSEISLNALNVQPGSVRVKAGGRELVENIDYTVDYTLGRVKIINQSLLESNTPISIESENNSLFNIQTKTLLGVQMDYQVNDNFNLGATVMHLSEQPLTQKVNIGDEPISNTIWGLNGSYQTESMFLTRMIDKIPFIETKEPSKISVEGEFAQLRPGHNKSIGSSGTAYIDDFEGTQTSIDMKSLSSWVLASTPQNNDALFPEGNLSSDLAYGFNRAKLAWYVIDPLFLRNNSATPGHIKADKEQQSNHFVREIFEEEIWPNKERASGVPTNISVLNLAYYPDEKGPYNYDVDGHAGVSQGMNPDGTLEAPETRWGGIMRRIETNDFEAANIAYIEFWMMDPFVYDKTHKGGDLYFNLGNVSEDILRDSRKSFENGLPTNEDLSLVDNTVWGRVPKIQSQVIAFDNNTNARKYQDVGLDGLNSEEEVSFFDEYIQQIELSANLGVGSGAYVNAINDPSGDDYHYFRGSDYDADEVSILERYKRYNGPEGNSPTAELSAEPYPTSATTLPNVEDINNDQTLSETEAYYQYRVHLEPTGMEVGKNFITDKITSTVDLANGTQGTVDWYQFKIPVNEFEDQFGSISDFTSIRFMRMFMKGFEEDVIMRFATLDLVRDDWRKYEQALNEDKDDAIVSDANFDITAINIEENASKEPVNYVLPPGIDRVVDPSNPQLIQLNEQAILLKVTDLENGKGKGAYKTLSMDVRKYGKLIMDVHAEEISGLPLRDNEVTAFIRLGSDYQDNYYEYEIPLKLTAPGLYNGDNENDRLAVWPDENRFDFKLRLFQTIKQLRNDAMRSVGSSVDYLTVYDAAVNDLSSDNNPVKEGHRVRIKGNPNLANVRTIMIGIKNPFEDITGSDDNQPKSVEVWMNELRLTDFDEDGGWAANLRVTTKLADLGTVTWSGSQITSGFGGIEDGVNERYKDDIFQYDFSASLELGKFFPEKSGVRIPMYYAISEETVTPEYDPLDPDIPLDVALENAENKEEREEIKHRAQEYTKRKSFNLTNVRIEKQEGKAKLLDVSNLSMTYSYNETYSRDVNTTLDLEKNYRGVLSYNYTERPKIVQPFKKVKAFQKPMFRLLKDFNFYYLPTQLSFRSDIQRYYHEIEKRNIEEPGLKIDPSYDKDFIWYRYYDLKYNLTKGLKFDFSATNTSRIDEPDGIVDKHRDRDAYEIWKDSIWNNLMDGGRNIKYHHKFNVTYTVPINKIPLLNWTSLNARYSGAYDWNAGAITADTIELGNTIRNSNNIQLNGQLKMTSLYNKVGILKKINRKYNSNRKYKKKTKSYKKVNYDGKVDELKAGVPVSIYHKLMTEDITIRAYDKLGKEVKIKVKPVTGNRAKITASRTVKDVRVRVTGKVSEKDNVFAVIGENFLRTLMSVRNISVNYSEINSTTLPGYLPQTNYFGGESFNGTKAPGFGFLTGQQDKNFARNAADKGWITTDPTMNDPYVMSHTQNFSIRSTIEPFKGLKIDLTANRNYSRNRSEYYIYNKDNDRFSNKNLVKSGNFSMSFLSLKSAFFTIGNTGDYSSEYFNKFLENRKTESLRLAQQRYGASYENEEILDDNNEGTGYYKGFTSTSQEVLVPAFLKAYGNVGSGFNKLFPGIAKMKPNWRVSFEGLSKIPFIRRYFKSINLSHAYTSTYDVGSYTTNLAAEVDEDGFLEINKITGNFYNLYDVNSISINEQFNPLINVDMIWKNNFSTSFEIKRTRNLILSLSNTQLTEVASNEMIFGMGYRFDNFGMIIGSGSRQKKYNSDLNLRADLSVRKNSTIIRKIVDEVDQLTSGQKVVTLKFSADYVLSNRFNLRLYYDRIVNTPYVSLSYPTTTTEFGASIRFTLAN